MPKNTHGKTYTTPTAPFQAVWDEMTTQVHENAKDKGWWESTRNDGETLCLIHAEVSEALEALRAGNLASMKAAGFSQVEEELADVVIRIMDYAAGKGLDVAGALEAKHRFNKSRPYRHGKQF